MMYNEHMKSKYYIVEKEEEKNEEKKQEKTTRKLSELVQYLGVDPLKSVERVQETIERYKKRQMKGKNSIDSLVASMI